MRGESTPKRVCGPSLETPGDGSIHREVGRFLNLDTLEQRQSPVQPPPRGKGGGTPRLKMRGVYSVDERFLPGLRFCRFVSGKPDAFSPWLVFLSLAVSQSLPWYALPAGPYFSLVRKVSKSTPKGAEAPLWNPRGGSIHRNVGRFLNLDTLAQPRSPVLYSVDERFLPRLAGLPLCGR